MYIHVYNRTINDESLFYKPDNYIYFLNRYKKYLNPYVDTLAYCLLPNHFHLLIRPRKAIENQNTTVSNQFRKFFISYVQAINKQEDRNGSLLQKNFKRKRIKTMTQIIWLIYYIHRNPLHHGITQNINYKWSSYRTLISNLPTSLNREKVHNLFGSRNSFKKFHKENRKHDLKKIQDVILE